MSECVCHSDRPCLTADSTIAGLGVLSPMLRPTLGSKCLFQYAERLKTILRHTLWQKKSIYVQEVVIYATKLYQ